MAEKVDVRVRRVYEPPSADDGVRVLVDRIWPRGLTKAKAALDEWCRAIAPSTELRKWYGHDPDRFEEFRRRYLAELDQGERSDALARLVDLARDRSLTLLTATKQSDISEAAVLAGVLGPTDQPGNPHPGSPGPRWPQPLDEGGDPACWAGVLCPECGAVLDGGPHRQGCPAAGGG